ncbi:MAG: spondin domain-containing protein [Planctomycetota bacterium]|jgi:hypothetical protein
MKKQVKTIKPVYLTLSYVLLGLLLAAAPLQAKDQEIIVRIENLGPEGGVYFTPVWMGFHDGSFDLFDPGGLASEALERLAEDGDASQLRRGSRALLYSIRAMPPPCNLQLTPR